jgi:hypothetical protein
MRFRRESVGIFAGAGRAVLTGVLCVLIVEQPMVAAASVKKPESGSAQQIQGDERVLHVLNRFTFGARPGDVQAVRGMGVKEWFEWQLNPMSIDDSALEARLEMFPAMQMEQAEMMERYPSPQVLRQIIAKGLPLPADPVEHAIYADDIALYKAAKAKQEAKQAANADVAGTDKSDGSSVKNDDDAKEMKSAALPGDGVDPAAPAMATHEEQFYSGL